MNATPRNGVGRPGIPGGMVRFGTALVSVTLVLLAGACVRVETRRHPGPVGSPTVAPVSGPVAFHVKLRAGQTLTMRSPAPDRCPGLDALLDLGGGRTVRLVAYATTCTVEDNERPGNGRHGVFRTAADIPPDRRADAIRLDAPLGYTNVFSQKYYECTNSCKNYTEPVAVIELADPTDPAFPTLTAYSEKGSAGPNDLITLVGDLVA